MGEETRKEGRVGRLIEQLLEERDEARVPEAPKVTFSIRMDTDDVALLEKVAGEFGMKKTTLANELLHAALEDAAHRISLRDGGGDRDKELAIYLGLVAGEQEKEEA